MRTFLYALLALVVAWTASAATTNNDDSCDIAVMPAATLLLPYFEVDLDDPAGETTLLTITNVSNFDAIARVTLWTDRAYPVITFNVYLTGYDVQAFNLFDIFARGIIAPDAGTGTDITRREEYSDRNLALNLAMCDRLPGALDDAYVVRMQSAFREGTVPDLGTLAGCGTVGDEHDHAVGYATIDVVGQCESTTPTEPAYWTSDVRYDNVLIGEYLQIHTVRNLAQGGPLVHIRAVPEGDARTFYARYQSPLTPHLDRRQPLPSLFATRWIQGGSEDHETSLKIWREGRLGGDATCSDYASEDDLAVREIVVFDEQENAVGSGRIELPATSRNGVDASEVFPQLANGATAGWMYLNLDRGGRDEIANQAWVISSMRASATYSTDIDGIALGNGCSDPAKKSEINFAHEGDPIAPAPNKAASHAGTSSMDNDDSCDIALLPAATLLLPYFEVEFVSPAPPNEPPQPPRDPTLFTITNVSPVDQIARVTLWTDYAFPVLTFNIFLTGYDVQSINLEDIIRHGIIAPQNGTGTSGTRRGEWSHRNRAVETSACGRLPGRLPEAVVAMMQRAFLDGELADAGDLQGCRSIGDEHDNAIGYATIDLVRNCESNGPFSDEYWTEDLAFDNVLIGDYQQVDPYNGAAGGAPLVHIRAIPEGGTSAERLARPHQYDAGFTRTFYSRYQPANAPRLDGRQPLPSVFAARWSSGFGMETFLKIWREGRPGRTVSCLINQTNFIEAVIFDEQENAGADPPVSRIGSPIIPSRELAPASRLSIRDREFPQMSNGAVGGWIYLNLDNDWRDTPHSSSNWVITSVMNRGHYSVDIDAAALGNGCSAEVPVSEVNGGSHVIAPPGDEEP